jgi:hypothetical protein
VNESDDEIPSTDFLKCIKTPKVFEELNEIIHLLKARISLKNVVTLFEISNLVSPSEDQYACYVYTFARICKTLYCTPLEMQLVGILEQLFSNLQIFLDAFYTKITEGRKMVW